MRAWMGTVSGDPAFPKSKRVMIIAHSSKLTCQATARIQVKTQRALEMTMHLTSEMFGE